MSEVSRSKAEAYFKAQNYDKALSVLKRILDRESDDIAALMLSALIHSKLARFSKANKHLNRIIELAPNHTGALLQLASNYSLIGENNKAITIYSGLLKTNPKLTELPKKLAYLYNKTEQYDSAIRCIKKYLKYAPSDSIAWLELGYSHNKRNELTQFKDAFIKAHKLEFDEIDKQNQIKELSRVSLTSSKKSSKFSIICQYCWVYFFAIFALLLWWQYFLLVVPIIGIPTYIFTIAALVFLPVSRILAYRKKKEVIRIKLETSHENIDRWREIIRFQKKPQDIEKLVKICEFAIFIFPSESNFYLSLGNAYFRTNFYSKAIEIFKEGLKKEAENISLLNYLGATYTHLQENTKAESTLKSAITISPNNLESLNFYGRILYGNKKYAESSKFLKDALDLLNEEMKRLLWKLPKVKFPVTKETKRKFTLKKIEGIDEKYDKLSSYIKNKVDISYILGMAYKNIGEFDKAEKLVQESLSVMENASAYNLLSYIHFDLENYQKCIDACYKSLDIDENQERVRSFLPHIYFVSKETTKALETITLLLQKYPEDEFLWNELGYIYSKTGEFEKATDELNKAIQINYKYIDQ